ncbi:MAG: hypothetical protein IPP94_15465 [Ignavibacteria bacterium]|nr:hypothetical protein [Ignavibacteria bacterium]
MKRSRIFPVLFLLLAPRVFAAGPDALRLLPKSGEHKGWMHKGAPRVFEHDKLWEYINGGADVYLDFGFQRVVTVDLENGKRSMTVDLYEMKTLEGAFGIYARERAPTYAFQSIGAQGYLEGVALNFYQANYYAKITAFSDDQETRAAMQKIAGIVSQKIGIVKKAPSLLGFFPAFGLQKHSETFEMKSYLDRTELRGAYTAKYTVKGKSFTAFFATADNNTSALSRLRALKAALSQPVSKNKDYAGLGDEVLTGRHREAKDIVLIAKGRYIVGLFPATDAKVAKEFLKGFLSRIE